MLEGGKYSKWRERGEGGKEGMEGGKERMEGGRGEFEEGRWFKGDGGRKGRSER